MQKIFQSSVFSWRLWIYSNFSWWWFFSLILAHKTTLAQHHCAHDSFTLTLAFYFLIKKMDFVSNFLLTAILRWWRHKLVGEIMIYLFDQSYLLSQCSSWTYFLHNILILIRQHYRVFLSLTHTQCRGIRRKSTVRTRERKENPHDTESTYKDEKERFEWDWLTQPNNETLFSCTRLFSRSNWSIQLNDDMTTVVHWIILKSQPALVNCKSID